MLPKTSTEIEHQIERLDELRREHDFLVNTGERGEAYRLLTEIRHLEEMIELQREMAV